MEIKRFFSEHTKKFLKRLFLFSLIATLVYSATSYFIYYQRPSSANQPNFLNLAASRSGNIDTFVVALSNSSNLTIRTLRLDFIPQGSNVRVESAEVLNPIATVAKRRVLNGYSVAITKPGGLPKGTALYTLKLTFPNNTLPQVYTISYYVNGDEQQRSFYYTVSSQGGGSPGEGQVKAKYVLRAQKQGDNIDIVISLCAVSDSFTPNTLQVSLQFPANRVQVRQGKVEILSNKFEKVAEPRVQDNKIAAFLKVKEGEQLSVTSQCLDVFKFLFAKKQGVSGEAVFNLRKPYSKVYIRVNGQDTDILDRDSSTQSVSVNLSVGQNPTNTPAPTPTPGTAPTSTPTPTPTPTQRPSGGGAGGNTTLRILVKFQGINDLPKSGVRELPVKVGLQRVGSRTIEYKTVNFRVKENGVWEGEVAYNVSNNLYFIFIKGPKHIGKKICEEKPREGYPGAYRCPQARAIRLERGKGYNFDFTDITLLAGDLPEQDGLVNAYDLSLVRNLLGKTDADSLAKADVNLDGVVDTQDFALIQAALSVKYDDY